MAPTASTVGHVVDHENCGIAEPLSVMLAMVTAAVPVFFTTDVSGLLAPYGANCFGKPSEAGVNVTVPGLRFRRPARW